MIVSVIDYRFKRSCVLTAVKVDTSQHLRFFMITVKNESGIRTSVTKLTCFREEATVSGKADCAKKIKYFIKAG
ncbi:hypothetical protein GZ77_25720 [Endozoicomonas montiporae]|uniref:Uncharacterized protein n=2 Tax=Endozoicomonas montiporae TaxID=1027273 RepID=A0A081MZ70_9GAMM|nr:hypothetical protein EZMO1_0736 [Endozoicomonas montiporae CL-33]KEQ11493.1 hypothetical protein GZ77_25720 [Endozoicomonas montiporae]